MSDHLVEITLHGKLGKKLVRNTWKLSVSSASEGIHAINKMSGGKLFQLLAKEQKKNQKYKILLNDKPLKIDTDVRFDETYDDKEKSKKQIEAIGNSELTINNTKLEKVDFIPVVEGAYEMFTIIFAIIIIIIGIVVSIKNPALGAAIIMAGVGLLAAGISALMMEPPEMDELRTLEGATSASYMFNGPVNIAREGGPVPICYGRLLCGGQVLGAWYDIDDIDASANSISN